MTIININNKLNNNNSINNDDDSQKTSVPGHLRIYQHWKNVAKNKTLATQKKLINPHRLKDKTIEHLNVALKDYTIEEICEAIDNYAEILASDKHRLTYRWTFEQFIVTADYLDLFLTENDPLSNPRWLKIDFSEEEKREKGLREAARNCLRTTPGCFSDSKKDVCVICRKYR